MEEIFKYTDFRSAPFHFESSVIDKLAYNVDVGLMLIQFKSGNQMTYNVSESTWRDFLNSSSLGHFYNAAIKGAYKGTLVDYDGFERVESEPLAEWEEEILDSAESGKYQWTTWEETKAKKAEIDAERERQEAINEFDMIGPRVVKDNIISDEVEEDDITADSVESATLEFKEDGSFHVGGPVKPGLTEGELYYLNGTNTANLSAGKWYSDQTQKNLYFVDIRIGVSGRLDEVSTVPFRAVSDVDALRMFDKFNSDYLDGSASVTSVRRFV